MFWYDHSAGWGWFAMSVGMLLFWALIIALGVLLYRALARPGGNGAPTGPRPTGSAAEHLLAERFARGEIDEEEYRHRLAVLRENTGGSPRKSPAQGGGGA
ncbi:MULTISPECIES: SHOCT domain-containing protein [unclassified Streptomyces]|jgi:putative membrane protein|uniref:SHOCT domain-containing protein n=1 Tax=unclassified Streptomyces TaxID=2593676 RepID=UPI0033177A5E